MELKAVLRQESGADPQHPVHPAGGAATLETDPGDPPSLGQGHGQDLTGPEDKGVSDIALTGHHPGNTSQDIPPVPQAYLRGGPGGG